MSFKETLKKTWNFLWNDDSIYSWIVSLILAFVIVKFVFFPGLSFLLATKMPLVVVESNSMSHPGSFVGNAIGLEDNFKIWWENAKDWYENKNINETIAKTWPLKTGIEIGDIILVKGDKNLKVGDIIIFNANAKHPIIHRIVGIEEINNEKVYSTKGDNNEEQLITEKEIKENAIIGKAIFKIPKLGWIKLAFVKVLNLA